MIEKWLYVIETFIIVYFIIVNSCYLLLLFCSLPRLSRYFKESTIGNINNIVDDALCPPVAAIIAAHNEEASIIDTVYNLLDIKYKNFNIIIVNDGSTDATLAKLIASFELYPVSVIVPQSIKTTKINNYYVSQKYPKIVVLDKEHAGKADSLNVGLNACRSALFVTIDADTILEPDTISSLVFSMLSHPHTIAEGGAVYILNGCNYAQGKLIEPRMASSFTVALQTFEYLRVFMFGRTGWESFNGPVILSGALTLFERKAVMDVGGYEPKTIGEDMEVVVKLHAYMGSHGYPYRIGYTPSAVAWTEVPDNLTKLWRQRSRWHRALFDCLWRYKFMFFNPKYNMTGLFVMPFFLLGEFLGPIVEFTGYVILIISMYLDNVNWAYAILFFALSLGFSLILTLATMLMSLLSFNKYRRLRDIFRAFLLAFVEHVGLRQYLVVCRLFATIRYLSDRLKITKQGWRTL